MIVACAGAVVFVALPLPEELLERRAVSSLTVLDRHGTPLREEPTRSGERSIPLEPTADHGVHGPGGAAPRWVGAAFIAVEDHRYHEHWGVDVRAMARAARDSLRAGRVVSGASTIPQQLARRLVPRPRTAVGKLQEILWALRLSAHLDKERLLVEYLNRVPLGHGTVGVEAASQLYFGVSARILSPAQAALLAGIAHAPAREDPLRHPESARARRDVVLGRMVELGVLDDGTAARARAEALELAHGVRGWRAPHFSLRLADDLERRGLRAATRVRTTIDAALQDEVERIVASELSGPLAEARVGQAAVVVLDNATGELLAWVGSRAFFDAARQGMNNGVTAGRQPGSALKPFVYGLALASGMTAATILPDVELTFGTETGTYAPRNYDKRVHGPVRLRTALQNSFNIPAVHLAEVLTPGRVVDVLRRAGFASLRERPEHYGVGVVLGNGDVTLLEMAAAYRGLARGGVAGPVVDVLEAHDGHGARLSAPAAQGDVRFLPADAVALLTDIMSDEESRAVAFGLDNALHLPFPVAAKTGTSRAYVDNWAAGFTHERTVAVWAGNFDGIPMRHVSGISGAGVIFRRVMLAAMEGVAPARLVEAARFDVATICPLSGLRAGAACTGRFDERFLPGTAPMRSCDVHHHVAREPSSCASLPQTAVDLPPRYAAWARAEGFTEVGARPLCPEPAAPTAGPAPESGARRARLVSPAHGDEFLLEPGLPSGQGIPVRVVAPGLRRLEVRADDGEVVALEPPFRAWLSARPGHRRVELYEAGGGAPLDVAEFVVR